MYGKLFQQMYDGTLATKGPWQALVTFQQLVILADKHGCVDMTAEAVSRRTTVPLDVIQTGLEALIQPDPDSRSPDEQGRRIVQIDPERSWGWRIVNYSHYRKIRSEEERREYHRNYMRVRRGTVNQNVKELTGGDQSQPIAVSSKQYAEEEKHVGTRLNGAHQALPDASPVVETLPLLTGKDFEVRQSFVAELEPLYPAVDVLATVREMKGWLIGNPARRKTPRGIRAFITRWLHTEQQKASGAH